MKNLLLLAATVLIAGCAQNPSAPAPTAAGTATPATAGTPNATAAVSACKSALALRSGQNAVFVLPVSHVAAAGGYEVFLSLKGEQWLCMTDAYNNVNRLEKR